MPEIPNPFQITLPEDKKYDDINQAHDEDQKNDIQTVLAYLQQEYPNNATREQAEQLLSIPEARQALIDGGLNLGQGVREEEEYSTEQAASDNAALYRQEVSNVNNRDQLTALRSRFEPVDKDNEELNAKELQLVIDHLKTTDPENATPEKALELLSADASRQKLIQAGVALRPSEFDVRTQGDSDTAETVQKIAQKKEEIISEKEAEQNKWAEGLVTKLEKFTSVSDLEAELRQIERDVDRDLLRADQLPQLRELVAEQIINLQNKWAEGLTGKLENFTSVSDLETELRQIERDVDRGLLRSDQLPQLRELVTRKTRQLQDKWAEDEIVTISSCGITSSVERELVEIDRDVVAGRLRSDQLAQLRKKALNRIAEIEAGI